MKPKSARGNAHEIDWSWRDPNAPPSSLVTEIDRAAVYPTPGDVTGWSSIAKAANLSTRDAQHLSSSTADTRLPVTLDRGAPHAYRDEIAAWRRRHNQGRPFLAKLRGAVTQHNAHALYGAGVYAVTFNGCGRIKIGFTASLCERIDSLETASPFPLEALAFVVGDRALERELHRRLADHRAHREWFLDNPEVRTTLVCTGRKHGGVWAL